MLLIIVGLIVWRMVPAFTQMQAKIDRVNQIAREQLSGIRVIRAFVREREERARFSTASSDVMATGLRAGNLMAIMFPAVMLVMNLSSVAVIWFGAFQVQENGVEIGTIFAFLNYMMQILMGVMMATFMFVMIPRAAVCANRIKQVLDTDPSVAAPADPAAPPASVGSIEFEHVDFAYPGADDAVLHDLSFTVAPGTTTAIIGSTGAGKTTLIGLIPRLFDVTGGVVRVDGVDVRHYEPDLLWDRIGLIQQRAFLFSGTIASNLRYGDDDRDRRGAVARRSSSRRARTSSRRCPRSSTRTSPRAARTSRAASGSGWRSRGRSRSGPRSTSSTTRSPRWICGRMPRSAAHSTPQLPEATRIVVAQRVSTIQHADQIVVLDHGRMVGIGKHDDLVETCETYREIVESQLAAEAAA